MAFSQEKEDIFGKISRVMETNIDFEILLEELGCEVTLPINLLEGWSHDLAFAIEEQAEMIDQSPPTFATSLLIKRFRNTKEVDAINQLVGVASELKRMMYFDEHLLLTSLEQNFQEFDLFCLLKLHENKLLFFKDVLKILSKVGRFSDHFISCLIDTDPKLISDITGIILSLISHDSAHSRGEDVSFTEYCRELLLHIVTCTYSDLLEAPPTYTVLDAIDHFTQYKDILSSFILPSLISLSPTNTVREMVSKQEEVTHSLLPVNIKSLYTKMATLLGCKNTWTHIMSLAKLSKTNWRRLLQFTVCSIHVHSSTIEEQFSKMVYDMIQTGVKEEIPTYLLEGLLLGRQCCLEGGHLFLPYKEWYKSIFGSTPGTVVDTKKNLIFVVKCFEDILQDEPTYCLKAHVQCPPRRLAKCQSFVNDYIELVKTRLSDLNEPFNEEATEGHNELSLAEEEVKEFISLYSNSQSIPPKLSEYHMFRCSYYKERILRVLLSPRQVPSPPDARERLIQALDSNKMIPEVMFKRYQKECKKFKERGGEERELPAGLNQALLYSPLEEKLQRLCRHYKDNKVSLEEVLSQVSSSLTSVINDVSKTERNIVTDISSSIGALYSPGLCQWEIQVINLLLEYISECIINLSLLLINEGGGATSYILVYMCVKMLSSHVIIHWPLLVRLWELLYLQANSLTESHLYALAVLCAEMYHAHSSYRPIELKTTPTIILKSSSDYSIYLLGSLVHDTAQDMLTTARFMCHFFQHLYLVGTELEIEGEDINSSHQLFVPLIKFQYIYRRLSVVTSSGGYPLNNEYSLACKEVQEKMSLVINKPKINKLYESIKGSPGVWLPWELSFDVSNDFLSPLARHQFRRSELCNELYEDQILHVLMSLLSLSTLYDNDHLKKEEIREETNKERRTFGNNGLYESFQLIVELFGLIVPNSDKSLPLLLTAIKLTLEKHKTLIQCTAYKSLVYNSISCIMGLPPYLLFCDTLSYPPTQCLITSSSHFINQYMISSVCENFQLSFDFSYHILQGLIQVQQYFAREKKYSSISVIETCFQECPILLTSIICNWTRLCQVSNDSIKEVFIEFKTIDSLHNWIDSKSRTLSNKYSISEWFSSHLSSLSVLSFIHLSSQGYNSSEDIKSFLSSILHLPFSYDTKKLIFFIFDCSLRKLLNYWPQLVDMNPLELEIQNLMTLAKCCLLEDRSVWSVCCEDKTNNNVDLSVFRNCFPSEGDHRLLPYIFLRLLIPIDRNYLQQVVTKAGGSELITFIHSTHSKLLSSSFEVVFSPSYFRLVSALTKTLNRFVV